MTSFNDLEGFLRALEENPEWKEAVRAHILGEELLQLPVRFIAFAGRINAFIDQMNAFVSEQRQFNAEQLQFNERMDTFVTEQRQFNEAFARRPTRIEGDMTNFRGTYAENAAERNAVAIAAELDLEYVRSVPQEDLVRMTRGVRDRLSVNQLRSFWTADLIIEASDGSNTHYIAVETSYTADQRDTDRVLRNVQFLTEFTGNAAQAVIASVRNDRYVDSQVESGAVYWYQLKDRGGRVPE